MPCTTDEDIDMKKETNPRLGRVGGGALIEGVMMRAGEDVAIACRRENGAVQLTREKYVPLRKKYPVLNIPILRGMVNFVEMIVLSMHTLNVSAAAYAGEEEEGRVEKWMKKHLGVGLYDVFSVIGAVLGVLLSVALFLYLPKWAVDGLSGLLGRAFPLWVQGVLEGGIKIVIFILYIWLVSLIPDIRRTFMYHGAEHKSIACYEAGEDLTPANAKKYTRFHPRCGTSFMFVMLLLGILLGIALRYILPAEVRAINWLYTLIRLLLLPVVVGLGFEFIMYAGRHTNALTRVLSAPGLWMQRLTTREPDESMLEIAITALKSAMPDEFPDFDPTMYDRSPAPAEEMPAEGADGENADVRPDGAEAPSDAPDTHEAP